MGPEIQQTETFTDKVDPGLLEARARWYSGVTETLRWVPPADWVSATSGWIAAGSATFTPAHRGVVVSMVFDASLEDLLFSYADDLSPTTDRVGVHAVRAIVPDLSARRAVTEAPDTDEQQFPISLLTDEEIDRRIAQYESQYGMTSEEFLRRRRKDTAPDTFDTMVWAALLDYR